MSERLERRRPILPPGSTAWVFAHEMRVAWRGVLSRRANSWRGLIVVGAVVVLFVSFVGVPLGFLLRHVEVPVTKASALMADLAIAVIGSLMLSQTIASAVESLYQRGDLDLMFSSPLAPRKTLTVRFATLAVNAFLAICLFFSPLFLPVAIVGHPEWLSVYVVMAALALTTSSLGLLLGMAMFSLIGPRRTRAIAQVTAALIGAGFFLGTQLSNIIGGRRTGGMWSEAMRIANDPTFHLPPGGTWPLRAMMGEPLPLLCLALGSILLFVAASSVLGATFVANAASASGADTIRAQAAARAGPARFSQGAFTATLRKELRLLWRDAALLSQVLLRMLYLLPLGFLAIRSIGASDQVAAPGAAAALTFMAGQVGGSLAWITVSAEDAPDLLACAPTRPAVFWRAKLAAAFLPMAVLLIPLLAGLTWFSPLTGLVSAAGCAAAAMAAGLINIWHQTPAKRSDFRRRRGSSWFATLAETIVAGLISVAVFMGAMGNVLALAPAIAAGAILVGLRRNEAQIAQAIRDAA